MKKTRQMLSISDNYHIPTEPKIIIFRSVGYSGKSIYRDIPGINGNPLVLY